MALNVSGKCKVYKLDVKEKVARCSLAVSRKNGSGWENEFYNGTLFRDALEKARTKGIPDKTKIDLTNAVLSSNKYNGNTYYQITIFDFDYADGEPAQEPQEEKQVINEPTPAKGYDMGDMFGDDESDLPF